jgi:RNA recognition motif-containing protein
VAEIKTTLILKNLPIGFSRDMVVDLLRSRNFADTVDFVYVPIDFRSGIHFGYAFVNLTSAESAQECMDKFDGFTDWGVQSDKVCKVSFSEMNQGLDAHVQRYRDSPVMHPGVSDIFKPALFKKGVRASFPRPTKPLRAPRLRKRRPSADVNSFEAVGALPHF